MKVLLMMNDLHGGGQEKAIVSLLSELSKKDEYDITLLLLRAQGVFLEDVPPSVQIRTVNVSERIIDSCLLSSKARIKKALCQGHPWEIVHVLQEYHRHRNRSISEIVLNEWKRYDHLVPVCMGTYDVAIDYQGQGSFPTYYIARKVKASKKYSWVHNDFSIVSEDVSFLSGCYSEYSKIISVSEKAKKAFVAKFPHFQEKAAVCYNVINKQEILEKAKETMVVPKEGINIVTVGRLSYQKGYDIAFQAIKRLKEIQKRVTYWVVGEGEEESRLKDLVNRLDIADCVCFVGFQKNPYPYIQMADMYLQPSRFEGYCLTLGEAKKLNKVIVTTDFAGASEQIAHRVDGSITACNEEDIFNELKYLIEHPELCDKYRTTLQSCNVEDCGFTQFVLLLQE